MTPRRHILLGLLFLSAIGILSYFTLFKTDFTLFEKTQSIVAYAEDAHGLRAGSPVLYAGVRWGKITSVDPNMERPRSERVRIDIELDKPIVLYGDHKVTIQSTSVLGGIELGIDPGNKETGVIDVGRDLVANSAPDALGALGELIDANREPITETIDGIKKVVSTLNGSSGTFGKLLNDEGTANNLSIAIDAVKSTFDNAAALTEELRGGQGTLGKLIYDPKLYDDFTTITRGLDEFVADARAVIKDAREGEGIIAALIYDDEIPEQVKTSLNSIQSAVAKIDEGDGTIARLINDGTIADEVQVAIRGFSNPDGTVGKLLSDSTIFDNFLELSADLAAAGTAIRNQDGTLGELIFDDTLVDDVTQAITILTGGLEEQREAAPIATFLTAVFVGF